MDSRGNSSGASKFDRISTILPEISRGSHISTKCRSWIECFGENQSKIEYVIYNSVGNRVFRRTYVGNPSCLRKSKILLLPVCFFGNALKNLVCTTGTKSKIDARQWLTLPWEMRSYNSSHGSPNQSMHDPLDFLQNIFKTSKCPRHLSLGHNRE